MRPSTPNPLHIHSPLDAVLRSLTGASLSVLLKLREIALEQMLPLYLVGGPVRDALLGMPIKDLDFVLEGDAPSLAARLSEELDGRLVVHSSFPQQSLAAQSHHLTPARQSNTIHPLAMGVSDDGTVACID